MPVLHEYLLADGVKAFSTTREGGVSEGSYASFNINTYCGDSATHIEANKKALATCLGIETDSIIMPHQIHEKKSVAVDEAFLKKSEEERHALLEGADVIMTQLKGICVGVSTADCVPILLYDTEHDVVCAVHAGWRGTVIRVVQEAIAEMNKRYNTRAADLRAAIGPCISLDSFEVGDEVYDRFAQAGFNMPFIARKYEKWHIDLPECNRLQMVESGVDALHIQIAHICTYKHSDQFFSARKLGINSGRIYSGILRK